MTSEQFFWWFQGAKDMINTSVVKGRPNDEQWDEICLMAAFVFENYPSKKE